MDFINFFKKLINKYINIFKRKENKDNEEVKKEDKTVNNISTTMIGANLTKTVSEVKSYKCWVQTTDGKIVGNTHIEMTVVGKTYVRDTDIDGVAELPIRLNKGDYEIHSVFKGVDGFKPCEITNYIHVDSDKVEEKKTEIATKTETKKEDTTKKTTTTTKTASKPKTVTYKPNSQGEFWNPRYLSNGEEKQSTNYYCAEVSIMQCFYELFAIDLSQRHIADIAGTTTVGTGHQGINRALEILQKEHNVKLSYSWKNFSQVGWDKLAQYCRDPNVAVIIHGGWAELGTWNFEAGHYYTMAMLNPSKKYGYEIYSLRGASLQKRSFDYLRASMNYISQPSICVITKN
ncbi:MAG: hypothetical protein MR750_08905 [Methanobrevibacter boviskoreani]|uniref:hypothetical protein n=1 Tax=Methanobrevibacter boviskoreani TaxID=1348249 RepID=UPI000593C5DF|nr:hypothetical protein [Methanobrevibacter boviskoreani]MCI6931354.1 hypothetical protein [Methanobrevibacter boviskoreani]